MRSALADFVVTQPLPVRLWGNDAFLCEAPGRLDRAEAVMVAELSLTGDGPPPAWRDVESALKRVSGIESEHLLRLIEAGPGPEGEGYVASEAAAGTLATPDRRLEEGDQIAAVARAALGAHALHESGIAHGSIHPSTILLTARGAVLAPPAPPAPQGVVVAMSDWRDLVTVAPDLLTGQAPSRASDIWSLGATLHLLLSPRPLFPAMSSEAPATAVQRIIFTRPEVDPALPPTVAEVVAACVATNPADRPPTAAEVARRLEKDGSR